MPNQDFNGFFADLKNDNPYIKVAFEGFAGSGKTLTAVKLAIGLHKRIGSKKPIAVYDTERAFRALSDEFKSAGVEAKVRKSRSLTDLEKAFDACQAGYSDILIIDSITHVWETFKDSYMEAKSKRMKRRVTKLSFPDWGYLKPEWKKKFSDRVVTAGFHVIFTGRAGYEYDHEEDEESGKMTELRKTGIRMKAESETAYEPDVLILMERIEDLMGKEKKIYRQAAILKDRYRVIDGKIFQDPAYQDFSPMIEKALDGEYIAEIAENEDSFEELNAKSEDWKKLRDVALEEIEGLIKQMGLGTGKDDQKLKVDILETTFATRSWTKIQTLPVGVLEDGVKSIECISKGWAEYLESCNDSGIQPKRDKVYEIISDVFSLSKKAEGQLFSE